MTMHDWTDKVPDATGWYWARGGRHECGDLKDDRPVFLNLEGDCPGYPLVWDFGLLLTERAIRAISWHSLMHPDDPNP